MYFEIPDRDIRILGSLHILPPGTSSLPAWASDAYEWAAVMAIEHERKAALEVIIAAVERREPWALMLAKMATWPTVPQPSLPDQSGRAVRPPWAAASRRGRTTASH